MRAISPFSILVLIGFVVLLCTVDSSLTTSIAIYRDQAYTPWLRRIGILTISDYIIVAGAVIVLYNFIKGMKIRKTPFLAIVALVLIYLTIGLLYNLGVAMVWKPFLYDAKTILYLTVPYFFLHFNKHNKTILKTLSPTRVFVYFSIAGVVDIIFTYTWGMSQYASYLGVPAMPEFLPPPIIMTGLLYSTGATSFLGFLTFFALDLFNAVNRLSLGAIYFGLFLSLVFLIALRPRFNKGLIFIVFCSVFMIFKILIPLALIYNPISMVKFKSSGARTRIIQMENSLANASMNFTGILGKGIGTTWFEVVEVPREDIYSVGTSVGDTVEEAMASKVKSIFNFGPASYLHKWGILGMLSLFALVTWYLYFWRNKLELLIRSGVITKKTYLLHMGLVFGSFLLMVDHVFYIGVIRYAMLTSIMVFWAEYSIMALCDTDERSKLAPLNSIV